LRFFEAPAQYRRPIESQSVSYDSVSIRRKKIHNAGALKAEVNYETIIQPAPAHAWRRGGLPSPKGANVLGDKVKVTLSPH